MSKFFCIGETLVDYFDNNGKLIPKAGGAPANVSVALAKLNEESYFLGGISNDNEGEFLNNTLSSYGVKLDYIKNYDNKTAYSKVELKNGDRKFSFFRENTADLNYEIDKSALKSLGRKDIVHFCSNCLMKSKISDSTKALLEYASNNNILISYDINLRSNLWANEEEMINVSKEFAKYANILKFSREEYDLMFKDIKPLELIINSKNIYMIIITEGENGATLYMPSICGGYYHVDALNKKIVDTTGAGDCFIATFLACISKQELSAHASIEAMEIASCACSVEVSRLGAMDAMPTLIELQKEYLKYYK